MARIILHSSIKDYDNVITVSPDGNADYTSVQTAIFGAANGTAILIYSGTYTSFATIGNNIALIAVDEGSVTFDMGASAELNIGTGVEVYLKNLKFIGTGIRSIMGIINADVVLDNCESLDDALRISINSSSPFNTKFINCNMYSLVGVGDCEIHNSHIDKIDSVTGTVKAYGSTLNKIYRNSAGTIKMYNCDVLQPNIGGSTTVLELYNCTLPSEPSSMTNITMSGYTSIGKPIANVDMNSKKLTGLAAGTENGDSVRFEQLVGGITDGRVMDYANVITVSTSGGADFDNIGSAVASLANHNTLILFFPGVYNTSSAITGSFDINISAITSFVGIDAAEGDVVLGADNGNYVFDIPASRNLNLYRVHVKADDSTFYGVINCVNSGSSIYADHCLISGHTNLGANVSRFLNCEFGYVSAGKGTITFSGNAFHRFRGCHFDSTDGGLIMNKSGSASTVFEHCVIQSPGITSSGASTTQNIEVYHTSVYKITDSGGYLNIEVYGSLSMDQAVSGSPTFVKQPTVFGKLEDDLDANGKKLIGLAAGTTNGDSVRYEQLGGLKGLEDLVTVSKGSLSDKYDYVTGDYSDDALCLQAAIDYTVANSKSGVLLFPGDYTIPTNSNNVTLKSGVDLIGMGVPDDNGTITGSVRIIGDISAPAHVHNIDVEGTNIKIANIQFDWHTGGGAPGLGLFGVEATAGNILFENCTFYRTGSVGTAIIRANAGAGDIIFRDCVGRNTAAMIVFGAVSYTGIVSIEYCNFSGSQRIAETRSTINVRHSRCEVTADIAFAVHTASQFLGEFSTIIANSSNPVIRRENSGDGDIVLRSCYLKNNGAGAEYATDYNSLLIQGNTYDNITSGLTANNMQDAIDELDTSVDLNNTHRGVGTGNPHSVSKSDVVLGNVTDNAQVKKISSNTDNNVPQWDGTAGDLLKDGLGVVTTIGTPGSDSNIPSEQAVREALDTQEDYGEMYISTPVATDLTGVSAGVFLKALGTTTAGDLEDFTMSANNRLTYGGTVTKKFKVTISISAELPNSSNQNVAFKIAKDGTTIAKSEVSRKIAIQNDVGEITTQCIVELAQNSYVELFVANEDAQQNVTVHHMIMVVSKL